MGAARGTVGAETAAMRRTFLSILIVLACAAPAAAASWFEAGSNRPSPERLAAAPATAAPGQRGSSQNPVFDAIKGALDQ